MTRPIAAGLYCSCAGASFVPFLGLGFVGGLFVSIRFAGPIVPNLENFLTSVVALCIHDEAAHRQ